MSSLELGGTALIILWEKNMPAIVFRPNRLMRSLVYFPRSERLLLMVSMMLAFGSVRRSWFLAWEPWVKSSDGLRRNRVPKSLAWIALRNDWKLLNKAMRRISSSMQKMEKWQNGLVPSPITAVQMLPSRRLALAGLSTKQSVPWRIPPKWLLWASFREKRPDYP